MAWSSAGGTDRVSYNGNISSVSTTACVAFRFKSSQATTNVQLFGRWSGTSREGMALLLNNTANKITLVGFAGVTQRVGIASTTTVNDGNWHSVVANINVTNGGANSLYVDGNPEGSANSSQTWSCGSDKWSIFGDSIDAFWPTHIGEIADHGLWMDVQLTADEAAAYAAGFSPARIRPHALQCYAPLVRSTSCLKGNSIPSAVGGGVAAHPRVIGSLV